MISSRFVSNCTEEQLDDLKIAALYFDTIEVVEHVLYQVKHLPAQDLDKPGAKGVVTQVVQLVTDDFRSHVAVLEHEGLLRYIDSTGMINEKVSNEIRLKSESVLLAARDFLYKETGVVYDDAGNKRFAYVEFTELELALIHQQFIGPLQLASRIDLAFIAKYYSALLSSLISSLSTGHEAITSSPVLNNFINFYYNDEQVTAQRHQIRKELGYAPNLAFEAIKVHLPDVSGFSFEDILEIRYQLRTELMRFRHEMAKIHDELLNQYDPLYVVSNAQGLVDNKINPSLDEINRKIKHTKSGVLKKLLDEIKNPKAYTPLIGTLFDKIPLHIATMLSVGLIGGSTMLDYLQELEEVKSSGLYYLIKLKSKTRK